MRRSSAHGPEWTGAAAGLAVPGGSSNATAPGFAMDVAPLRSREDRSGGRDGCSPGRPVAAPPACSAPIIGSGPADTGTPTSLPLAGLAVPVAPAMRGASTRTFVRRSEESCDAGVSTVRRSAGPPRAGSGPTAMKASSASVVARRRGMASWATVSLTSRRAGGRARMISMRAAPLATPRTRPMARNMNSLTVTVPASPGSCSLVLGDFCVGSVAASSANVNSDRVLRGARGGW